MLVYPGVVAMDVFGPLEAFATANAVAHRPLYRLAIAGMSMAPVDTSLGIRITPSVAVADLKEPIDTLLVSGGYGQAEASCDQGLLAWLKTGRAARPPLRLGLHRRLRARRGRPARRQAGDHALGVAEALARRYPPSRSMPTAIFVRDGNVCTSAGVTAGIDLALALVEEDHGRELALARRPRTSCSILKRPGGQSQFSTLCSPSSPPARRCGGPGMGARTPRGRPQRQGAGGARAHERAHTSRRAFAEETGDDAARLRRGIRIDAARGLFEEPSDGAAVATPAASDRRQPAPRLPAPLGVTPQQYRQRFRLADEEPARDAAAE